MTAHDPDGRIPEARLEPKTLAERMVRARAIAQRGLRRAAQLVQWMLLIALGVGVLIAAVALWSPEPRDRGDMEVVGLKDDAREMVDAARRDEEERNRRYAQELECRPPEYRPDARDAPFTP